VNFNNPKTEDINKVKRMIEFKLAIVHGTSNRPIFNSDTNGLTRINNRLCVNGITDAQDNPIVNQITSKTGINNLSDGKYDTYARFWVNENSYDIVFHVNEPTVVMMYSFVTASALQVPGSWKLYGAESLNGSWTLLDEQDYFPKPVTSYTEKAFSINAPKAYQLYRFIFAKCKFDLSQVHFYVR
jgi:hypothetical protein